MEQPQDVHPDSHGSSPAAWTGVGILLVATVLICLGMVLAVPAMWIIGIIGIIVGVAAWVGMTKAGYGEGGAKTHGAH